VIGRRVAAAAACWALAWASAAAAQPAPESMAESSWLAALGLKGTAIYKNFSHWDAGPNDDQRVRNEGILRLEWDRRPAPWLRLSAIVEARGDDAGFAPDVSFKIPETSGHRSVLGLKEVVAGLRFDPVDVTLGKQVFAWGTADTYNPTDLINPYDALDPIESEKLGVWSVAARWSRGPASAVLVVVPLFTPTRDPLLGSRWTPALTSDVPLVLDGRALPRAALGHVQYAARVKTTVGGIDVSLSYFEGYERTPVLRLATVEVAPGVVLPRVTPLFSRIRAPGADFSTTWGKLELHGEAAARFVVADGRDDLLQMIAGLNYTWDDFRLPWLQHVALGLEYAREVILSRRTPSPFIEPPVVPGLGEGAPFRDAPIVRLNLKFTEETSLATTALIDLDRSANAFMEIKLTHKLSDAVQVDAGFDVFCGRRDTIWGRWRDNDRFFAAVRYFF